MDFPIPQSPALQPAPTKADDPQMMEVGGPGNPRSIAFLQRNASLATSAPGLVWLPGFMSDMASTKASALDAWAQSRGRALLRFDYSGHGRSPGRFEDGTISRWLEEALAMVRGNTFGPQILIGSSMGAWLALLLARALGGLGEEARLHALVLIAPATDFTQSLIWPRLTPEIRAEIESKGQWLRPSAYGAPYPITRALLEDGRRHCLLDAPVRSFCPVHILQGMQDPDVPWQHAMRLVEHLADDPVVISLIKDGDHRLSRPQDIAQLLDVIAGMG